MLRYRDLAATGVLIAALVLPGLATAGQQTASAASPQTTSAQDYQFPSGAGILYFHVRADRTSDFEKILGRINEVLSTTEDPVRRRQAATWRIFRSLEQQPGETLYLFVFDPAVSGADYDPVRLLGEALPLESVALYETLKSAVIRVERMGLLKVR